MSTGSLRNKKLRVDGKDRSGVNCDKFARFTLKEGQMNLIFTLNTPKIFGELIIKWLCVWIELDPGVFFNY